MNQLQLLSNKEQTSVSLKRKYLQEEKNKVKKLFLKGRRPSEISRITGVNLTTIYNWTKRKDRIRVKKTISKGSVFRGTVRKLKEANQGNVRFRSNKQNSQCPVSPTEDFNDLRGFRELNLIQKSETQRSPNQPMPPSDVYDQSMIQIESPEGFKMWVPYHEVRVIALFFQGVFKCS